MYEAVQERFGKIDILFVNAGIAKFAPLAASKESLFDEKVKGAYFTMQRAIPFVNDGVSIVQNTSIVSSAGEENTIIHAASNAAVRPWRARPRRNW